MLQPVSHDSDHRPTARPSPGAGRWTGRLEIWQCLEANLCKVFPFCISKLIQTYPARQQK